MENKSPFDSYYAQHVYQSFGAQNYQAMKDDDSMLWNDVHHIFETDGALRDIIVRGTCVEDWNKLIELSKEFGNVSLQSDGENACLPTSAVELLADKDHAHCMKIDIGGPVANAHFFTPQEIELDLDPREIWSQAMLDTVLKFCCKLSLALGRDVLITEENNSEAVLLTYSFRLRSWQIANH